MKKVKVSYLITVLILTIQVIVMIVLFMFTNGQLKQNIKTNTVNSMQTIITERSTIIENYVREVEAYLTAYSRASDIVNLLKNPTDTKAQEQAQKFTEKFSGDMSNLEGIYASMWNTQVLTHTNAGVVGITTRTGDSLKALQDAMLSIDGVYNTGIIISPASKQQIISMYRAVLNDAGEPIGLVGGGIFTTGLKEILAKLPVNGLEHAKYYLVNANTGEFIFHENEEMIGVVAEDAVILNIIDSVDEAKESYTSFVEYEDESIAAYHYIADRGWIFLLTDTSEEIFASVGQTKNVLLVLCSIATIVLTGVTFVTISAAMRPLGPIGKLLLRMADCDIRKDTNIGKYIKRKDDLGEITIAAHKVIQSLRDIITSIRTQSTEMADNTVTLHKTAVSLVDCANENIAVAEELSASLENVNTAAENINSEIINIKNVIQNTADKLKCSDDSSDKMMSNAIKMRDDAENAFQNSKNKLEAVLESVNEAMERLNSLTEINGMAESILNITDQTNLLSLNASIEAARAGEAGKGFAVVASEIKALASNSGKTAANIQELCKNSNENITAVNECIHEIIQFIEHDILHRFEGFAQLSKEYSFDVTTIKNDIADVKKFVHNLQQSVRGISENISSVACACEENSKAIEVIVERNEETQQIAIHTQNQADANKATARMLDEVVHKFTL